MVSCSQRSLFFCLWVSCTQVFSYSRVFVFFDALEKVSASIANIICITQITFESIITHLLTVVCYFDVVGNFLACKHWLQMAVNFLSKIMDSCLRTIHFTMEVANNNKLPLIRMEFIKIRKQLKTCVYRKTTNKDPLIHY